MDASTEDGHVPEEDPANDEQRPLLPGAKYSDPERQQEGDFWSTRWVVLCALWLAQVFMTSAYSLIGPLEVSIYGGSLIT